MGRRETDKGPETGEPAFARDHREPGSSPRARFAEASTDDFVLPNALRRDHEQRGDANAGRKTEPTRERKGTGAPYGRGLLGWLSVSIGRGRAQITDEPASEERTQHRESEAAAHPELDRQRALRLELERTLQLEQELALVRARRDSPVPTARDVEPAPVATVRHGWLPWRRDAKQTSRDERTPAPAQQSQQTGRLGDDRGNGADRGGPRRRPPMLDWRIRLPLKSAAGVTMLSALCIGCMLVVYTIRYPDPFALAAGQRSPVIRILDRNGRLLAERGRPHDYIPIALLPKHVIDAVIATEDRRFYRHWGIDPVGLLRASLANLRAGRTVQGGSTLTQQLAKNMFLSHERTMARKIEELTLAIWLEARLTKAEILELYLNRVYFGAGAYGIEAAAQRYFGKSARALGLAEAAMVAGMLQAPSRYSPFSNPGIARSRARTVLAKMGEADLVPDAAVKRSMGESLNFAKEATERETVGVEYAVDHVLEHMPQLSGINTGTIVVETTIDADLQRAAQTAVARHLKDADPRARIGQAALVVLDMDGGIRAMVGGRSYEQSQFNRVTKARRQPGSVFKPFVYLAALERGMTPDSTTYDLPIDIQGWTPKNATGTFAGTVTLRQGLAQSLNTVAVRLQQDIGTKSVIEMARRLGVGSALREDASLALGTSEVNPLEMAGAYTAIANGGTRVRPRAIRRVLTERGRVLFAETGVRNEPILSGLHVAAMNDMLGATLQVGTGRRAALAGHASAGKTGTTQDFRDAWFIGYTAQLATAVWVGNDDGTAMDRITGGSLPAEIWREIMTAAHRQLSVEPLVGQHFVPHKSRPAKPAIVRAPSGDARDVADASVAVPPLPARRQFGIERAPRPAAVDDAAANRLDRDDRTVRFRTPNAPVAQRIPTAAPQPRMPSERIGEDFISRAVALTGPQPGREPDFTRGFDVDAIRQRLAVTPDRRRDARSEGMMSLGAP